MRGMKKNQDREFNLKQENYRLMKKIVYLQEELAERDALIEMYQGLSTDKLKAIQKDLRKW